MRRLAVVAALIVLLTVSGCGSGKTDSGTGAAGSGGPGTFVNDAKDNASIAACRTNRAQIDQQYSMAQSTGEANFSAVLEQSGAKCPSGGTYSWDVAANKTTCSVHGN